MSRKTPPGIVAAAKQDYHTMRDCVAAAVEGARLLVVGQGSEVQAFAEAYWTMTRTDPRVAAAIGAAAIVQLAMQAQDGRADT